jgi:hypothetical protein
MTGMLRTGMALGTALLLSMGPATAAQDLGVYQTTDRKMDFHLATCGKGDKLVIDRAKPAGNNVWRGTMQFGEYSLSGKMTLKPGASFKVSGCAYVVMCQDINLIPAN